MAEGEAGAADTGTVFLRDLQEDDVPAVYQMLSKEEVVRFTLFPVFTAERAQEFVAYCIKLSEEEAPSQLIQAVVLRPGERFAGLCGLVLKPRFEEAEAWYALDVPYWGQGCATAAAHLLLQMGFEQYALHRIWATCMPENPASARVLEKNGFRREGYLREALKIQGDWRDVYLYAILRREWQDRSRLSSGEE